MKKFAVAALAATSVFATPAYAQSATASDSFNITGNVLNECSIDDPQDVTFPVISINQDSGAGALLINANSSNQQRIWVSCNYATTLTVSGTELENAAGAAAASNDPNDFTNVINYFIKLEPGAAGGPFPQVTMNSKNASNTANGSAGGAFHDQAKLNVQIAPGDNPKRPVAGQYTAVATVTLGAI